VLPLQYRITYHLALLVCFKIHNDLAPNYLNTIALIPDVNKPNQKNKSYYSNLTRQSLSTPNWNNIPEHMKSAITVNTYK